MIHFNSEGNVIDFQYKFERNATIEFSSFRSDYQTYDPVLLFTASARITSSYSFVTNQNQNSATLAKTTYTIRMAEDNGTFYSYDDTSSAITQLNLGELSYATTFRSMSSMVLTSPTIDSSTTFLITSSQTPSTTLQNEIVTVSTDTTEITTYVLTTELASTTFPNLYIGSYFTSIQTNDGTNDITSFVSTEGSTTTLGFLIYSKNTYSTDTISATTEYVWTDNTFTRTLKDTYAPGDIGEFYVIDSSRSEALLVLSVSVLNEQITEGCLTDIADYWTVTQTTLYYSVYTNTFNYTPPHLFSTVSFPGVALLRLNSPNVVSLIASSQTLYTNRNTTFTSESTFTYFLETTILPLPTDTSEFFSATSAIVNAATTANASFGFFAGFTPLINNRQFSLSTKSTNVPGLGVLPFSVEMTAEKNGIKEYIDIQTCYQVGNRSTSTTSNFFLNSPTIDFFPNINTSSSSTSSTSIGGLIAETHFLTSHDFFKLAFNVTSEFPNEPARSVQVALPPFFSRGATLYSNFIVPGIRVFNDTTSNIYKNVSIIGGDDIYELNNVSEQDSSFNELFVLQTFTNLRTFADDLKLHYARWSDSEHILMTILDLAGMAEVTYTVSYDAVVPVSNFYTTKSFTQNNDNVFDTTYQFGGPNFYSKSEVLMVPLKGKYDITRYNLLENSSSSVRTILNQYEVITCDTSDYIKFCVMPYFTLETAVANGKKYLDQTVLAALDVEE